MTLLGTLKSSAGYSLIAPLFILGLPILDTTQVVMGRLRRGSALPALTKPIFTTGSILALVIGAGVGDGVDSQCPRDVGARHPGPGDHRHHPGHLELPGLGGIPSDPGALEGKSTL